MSLTSYPADAIALIRASGAKARDFTVKFREGPLNHSGGLLPYLSATTLRGQRVLNAVGKLWSDAQVVMINAGDDDWVNLPTSSRVIADTLRKRMGHDQSDRAYDRIIAAATADLGVAA